MGLKIIPGRGSESSIFGKIICDGSPPGFPSGSGRGDMEELPRLFSSFWMFSLPPPLHIPSLHFSLKMPFICTFCILIYILGDFSLKMPFVRTFCILVYILGNFKVPFGHQPQVSAFPSLTPSFPFNICFFISCNSRHLCSG